jgi:hypothetical protein
MNSADHSGVIGTNGWLSDDGALYARHASRLLAIGEKCKPRLS